MYKAPGNVIEFAPKNALNVAPCKKHFSYVKLHWEPGYENYIREITAGSEDILPQDKLVYAFITVNPITGMAAEFGWSSGRKDVHIVADITVEALIFAHGLEQANEIIAERNSLIEALKEQYYDQGFQHGSSGDPDEYEGGFAEFSRNFERATGRRITAAVNALCSVELRATA